MIAFWIALLCLSMGWWLVGAMAIMNLRRARRLQDLPLPDDGSFDWPSLTIIAPARNEEAHLADAITTRLQTTYPDVTLLLIDDRSEDKTGAIADAMAAEDPRLQVIHNDTLPDGWLGKLYVLQLGTDAARGEWLLFSDADVEIAPDTLKKAVYHAESNGFDVLAAMPTLRPAGLWLDGLHAVFMRVLFAAFWVQKVEDPGSSYGVGVGAFTLVRKTVLQASPGFASLRMEVADDLMLGRMLKAAGARCTILNGAGAASVDIYPTAKEFIYGAEKNAWGVSAQFSLVRGIASALVLLLMDLSPLLLLLAPLPWYRLYGAALLTWALGVSVYVLHHNGRTAWGGLLYPLGTLLFVYGAIRGTCLGWWRGGLQWRDTFYRNEQFLQAKQEQQAQQKKP